MKNQKKRGFTIVELVIVIAVIAILAAVLIPTFSGIVKKANESVAMQEARSAWTEYMGVNAEKMNDVAVFPAEAYIVHDGFAFEVNGTEFNPIAVKTLGSASKSVFEFSAGNLTGPTAKTLAVVEGKATISG